MAYAQSKARPSGKTISCPDDSPTIGWYRNYSYGFSMTIPRRLKGYWNSVPCIKETDGCVCMGDHGRFIPITKEAYLDIEVGPMTSETRKETINDEVRFALEHYKEKGEAVETVRQTTTRLDSFRATRLKLRFTDAKTKARMIEERIICMPIDKEHGGWVYSIYLVTPTSSYRKHKLLHARVSQSWRFRSRL